MISSWQRAPISWILKADAMQGRIAQSYIIRGPGFGGPSSISAIWVAGDKVGEVELAPPSGAELFHQGDKAIKVTLEEIAAVGADVAVVGDQAGLELQVGFATQDH